MARTDKAARRAARTLILQVLYELDLTDHKPALVMADHIAGAELDDETERFARAMVAGVVERREELDGYIQKVAPEWPTEQMAPIDRGILRMAMYELLYQEETPVRIAINEAVELAREFGSENSRRFVNGALGTFAREYLDRA
jgi:transcription antitermination protein NusB